MHIHILYSSGGGNTKFVIDTVAEILLQASHEVSFSKAVVSSFADLTKADLTILACPTYDHGLLHTPFDVFLQSAREAKVDLKDQQFVLIGLGDPKYDKDYLVESVRLMQEFVTEHGGTLMYEPLKIIANPLTQVEHIQEWGRGLAEHI